MIVDLGCNLYRTFIILVGVPDSRAMHYVLEFAGVIFFGFGDLVVEFGITISVVLRSRLTVFP